MQDVCMNAARRWSEAPKSSQSVFRTCFDWMIRDGWIKLETSSSELPLYPSFTHIFFFAFPFSSALLSLLSTVSLHLLKSLRRRYRKCVFDLTQITFLNRIYLYFKEGYQISLLINHFPILWISTHLVQNWMRWDSCVQGGCGDQGTDTVPSYAWRDQGLEERCAGSFIPGRRRDCNI